MTGETADWRDGRTSKCVAYEDKGRPITTWRRPICEKARRSGKGHHSICCEFNIFCTTNLSNFMLAVFLVLVDLVLSIMHVYVECKDNYEYYEEVPVKNVSKSPVSTRSATTLWVLHCSLGFFFYFANYCIPLSLIVYIIFLILCGYFDSGYVIVVKEGLLSAGGCITLIIILLHCGLLDLY